MVHMDPTLIVLASVGLGIVAGALMSWVVFAAREQGRRRRDAARPMLPEAAVEVLHTLDTFAVILDASLSVVYANPAARDDPRVTEDDLRDPDLLARARTVMSSGTPDTRDPSPDDPNSTLRIRILRLQRRFLVVLAFDLGEEQRVNAMRRDFIANVSHELKTPIAAISLLSEAVVEAADEPDIVRNFGRKLISESQRLGDLSRDIIQLSEAQSSPRTEELEPVSLTAVVKTEVDAHRDYAAQRGVDLVIADVGGLSAAPGTGPMTLGRPAAIGTVIANLLSNAIRHSPSSGSVGIGIEQRSLECVITVTDQGEGISAEHLPRIFERFYRVDNARSRAGGGTGLGLSIARHTMLAHGGDIQVWSQPGMGSTFTLTFPIIDEPKRAKKQRKKAKPKKKSKSKSQVQELPQAELQGGDTAS